MDDIVFDKLHKLKAMKTINFSSSGQSIPEMGHFKYIWDFLDWLFV